MRRDRWLLFILIFAFAGGGAYLFIDTTERDDRRAGRFPELQPDLAAPAGYEWHFRDGVDFYVWTLAEPVVSNARSRSGIGIYVGLHPNPSKTAGEDGQIPGRICGRDATWLIERNVDPADTWIRRDALMDYVHGPDFKPVCLHIWVWGPTEAAVAELSDKLADLAFVGRRR